MLATGRLVILNAVGYEETPRGLYLSLLKSCLLDAIYEGDSYHGTFDAATRAEGRDWPTRAHTMIGRLRLDNVQWCVERVLAEGVPGDLMEAGVWRGGATILMRGVLKAHGVLDRKVWVADSFQGLPIPDLEKFPQDNHPLLQIHYPELVVGLEEVRANFQRYGLLDDQVLFIPGWFRDTLKDPPVESLAVLRLDGDLYESTIQSLEGLYAKVRPGGFVIVDDYGAIEASQRAVTDFRARLGITDKIEEIDWTGVFWRKGWAM